MTTSRQSITRAKRIVIKVGSALLAEGGAGLHASLARQVSRWTHAGHTCVVVSSGSIALGLEVLGLKQRPKQLSVLQAAAAAGQPVLMQRWSKAFGRREVRVAEVLLTHADLANRDRFLNARHALAALLKRGLIPVVNENDSVSTDEIKVGDNDTLSAQVASLVQADLLVLLTTVDGLYTANPSRSRTAEHIPVVTKVRDVEAYASDTSGPSGLGVGGMATKVQAALSAMRQGIPVVIADGAKPNVITQVLAGDPVGTLFVPQATVSARKHWIGFTLRAKGRVTVDPGAAEAITAGGRSLLASGITGVTGTFGHGDMVEIHSAEGAIARGLAAYGASELEKLAGHHSRDFQRILGYIGIPEAVHRDDMILIQET